MIFSASQVQVTGQISQTFHQVNILEFSFLPQHGKCIQMQEQTGLVYLG